MRLPYFDFLLAELATENPTLERSFGRHVHWGYWPVPSSARTGDADDYGRAAERLTLEICGLAGITDGEDVLDVGCGFGGTIASLGERHRRLRLVGVNIDERQLARAQQVVPPSQENAICFAAADACALPFPARSFDRVLAVECAFHFPSRATFLREAFRVLRPGGVLALSDVLPSQRFQPISRWGKTAWFSRATAIGRFDASCTLAHYRRIARAAGFESLAERNATATTLPTYDSVRAMLRRHRPKTERVSRGQLYRFGLLLAGNRILARLGLLHYYLLSFRKPE